jgi:peptidylprolyl isomerase
MTQLRVLATLTVLAFAQAAVAQAPPVPRPSIKMKGQDNLPAKEREALERKLTELAATRDAERKADLASMHAAREASDFALLKGDFQTHANGMFYRDAVVGEGPLVEWGDSVDAHYTTWHLDGRKFESSHDRGRTQRVDNVGQSRMVKAWNDGLLGMREGGKRVIIAQSAVAYGKFDSANGVKGGTHLVFEIELVKARQAPRRPDVAKLKLRKSPTGLRWVDLVVGDGEVIDPGDTAFVHYSGWLHDEPDTRAFDSTFQIGRAFPVADIGHADMIAAWNEGLIGMKGGGRRILLVPPELGFGEDGLGELVPPNATLLYLMEAWSVLPQRPDLADVELTTTESGLQWATLRKGKGSAAMAGDDVGMHFTGWLPNGQVFDSSWMVNTVVPVKDLGNAPLPPGLTEGLLGMRAGERRVLFIPSALAYGEAGANKSVPPNSDLTMLIDLVELTPAGMPVGNDN